MRRLLCGLLLALGAAPASAQLADFSDPTVWTSASLGALTWTQGGYDLSERDNVITHFGLAVASPRWMAQGGAQISGRFEPVFALGDDLATFRSVYLTAGPWTQSRWFMGGVALGPAVSWGKRLVPQVGGGYCYDNFCSLDLRTEREAYLDPGIAASLQGFVRLDGRVWLGGETMLVGNMSSSHLASRLAIRVDLLRPGR